jgi:hypothetical protein
LFNQNGKHNVIDKSTSFENCNDLDLNELYYYILTNGVKKTKSGKRVVDTRYIYVDNYKINIKQSLFEKDKALLNQLIKLHGYSRSDIFRIVIENVVENIISYKNPVDLSGIEFILENDLL